MDWNLKLRTKLHKLTLKSLVGMALQKPELDDEYRWEVINELCGRSDLQTIQLVQKLFSAHNWRKRTLAVDIICQLSSRDKGLPYSPYGCKCAKNILIQSLTDNHAKVIEAAIYGLGHRKVIDALPLLLSFTTHKNVIFRQALSFALQQYNSLEAIQALISLATDIDDETRNWATFALGSIHQEIDTPQIREILWLNTQDSYQDVIDEALAGLVIRKDPKVYELIIKILQTEDSIPSSLFNAIEEISDPVLIELLRSYTK